jgi:hypothetical protein
MPIRGNSPTDIEIECREVDWKELIGELVPATTVAVALAAMDVFDTGTAWPDLLVAGVMATLALTASVAVVRHAHEALASPACASS